MNPQELISRKRQSVTVIFHRFSLMSSMHAQSVVYCFFEGKNDSPYYFSRIESHTDKPIDIIVCYGKNNVIQIKNRLTEPVYEKYTKLYFIDNDFDDQIEIDHIFETKVYSIENYYCSERSIGKILKNEFHLTEDEEDYNDAMKTFLKLQDEFHQAIITFNAWYYWFKRVLVGDKQQYGVFLDDSPPDGFILINFPENVISNYSLEDISTIFPLAPRCPIDILESIKNKFMKRNLTECLRGKYELWFVKKYLRLLIEDGNDKRKRRVLHSKTKFNFIDNLFISNLSQYADTPRSLQKYLRVHISTAI